MKKPVLHKSSDKPGRARDLFFWRKVFLVILVLCLIPLAWIGFYAHAAGDDYAFSNYPYHAWQETHNLIAFFGGCAKQFQWNYFYWQGCFTAVILGTLDPVAFGDSWYILTPYILIGTLVVCNFVFFRFLFAHCMKGKEGEEGRELHKRQRAAADISSVVICLAQIELVPRAYDMFYWWDGAMNYLPFYGLILVVLALLIKLLDKHRLSPGMLILTCFLAFIGEGGNYVTALVNLLLILCMGVILVYMYVGRGGDNPPKTPENGNAKRMLVSYLLILISAAAGLSVSILAPGNAYRLADEGGSGITSIPRMILKSIVLAGETLTESTSLLLILILLLLLPLCWKLTENFAEPKDCRNILHFPSWLILGSLFLLYAASFAPSVYVYGTEGVVRVEDVRFFYLVFFLVLAEFFLAGKARMALQTVAASGGWNAFCTRYMTSLLAFIVFYAGIAYLLPRDNREVLTSVCAARSLLIGEAQEFDRQMDERAKILSDDSTNEEDVLLEPLTERPYLLFLYGLEITEDPTHWINESVAEYFDKASVALYPEESEQSE